MRPSPWCSRCARCVPHARAHSLTHSPRPQGGYQSPRVINLLLQYLTQALAYSHTWKALKPHVEQLLLQ